jgi:hypothetical protein
MSTLWTPGGEHPVGREPAGGAGQAPDPPGAPPGGRRPGPPSEPGGPRGADDDPGGPDDDRDGPDEEMAAELDELRDQLAKTPAAVVVANHGFGLFELAALHLSLRPPQLGEAQLAIDALAALVEGLPGRLGQAEAQLKDGLAQLRLAYVQIKAAASAGGGNGSADGASGAP